MDEADELIELCVRALVAQMIAAPGVELHVTRTCVLGLTDEPLADFNRLILGAEAGAEEFLIRATARAKERGRPLVATMSPGVAEALGPVATRLGFAKVGSSPLMMLDPDVPVRPGRSLKIVRVLDAQEVAVGCDLADGDAARAPAQGPGPGAAELGDRRLSAARYAALPPGRHRGGTRAL